ncbi:winged helix family two component transcriptional regulator [Mobilisporobacter senegalensis]|uniref:Stage 0 sporulation protein A homolog n=1 Tax=Mobilisporobacter senegalensis TaxID=1329262 RepID=A0A3N1XRX2_9FIRM|nr:response regulator transcription factor [Mobilisporobacter senegalensis]ROR29410.1 winged helix family two component transcriptional regulator [Mobilisporobacter senegalensis]
MNHKLLILLVEDETVICNFISTILTTHNYNVIKANNGKDAISLATSHCPDLILLDLGLPDMDGEEIIKQIRSWSTLPIIVVSAREYEQDKVRALDLGADDYITKPFGTSELLARIRTGIRHSNKMSNNSPESEISIGNLNINYEKRIVKVEDKIVHLTPIEYKIITLLSKNIGKVLTHESIIKEIWGPFINENQALRVNMANIRRKIEKNPAEPQYIITEVGVGYRMVDDEG